MGNKALGHAHPTTAACGQVCGRLSGFVAAAGWDRPLQNWQEHVLSCKRQQQKALGRFGGWDRWRPYLLVRRLPQLMSSHPTVNQEAVGLM